MPDNLRPELRLLASLGVEKERRSGVERLSLCSSVKSEGLNSGAGFLFN